MTLLIYIIKTIFISGLLVGYYWLFLRNQAFHGFNRLFLISIPVLAFLLPLLQFRIPENWNRSTGSQIRLLDVGRGTLEEAVTIYATRKSGTTLSWEYILLTCSLFISMILFIRFFKTLHYIQKLRSDNPFLKIPEAILYFVSEKGTPFSFFRSIFWGNEMDVNSAAGKQILRHELFHVKQNHSLDIVSIEILSIGLWFNPFLYMIRRELAAIHEYGADAYASAETDRYEYASLLLLNVAGPSMPLTHPFFKSQVKRRIAMMMENKKQKAGLFGRLMILPLFGLLICLFSFKFKTHPAFLSAKTVRVVIDAGHGGKYTGASNANDSVPVDTLTMETMNKLDVSKIDSMTVDKKNNLIIIKTKDGKRYVEVITAEMSKAWDSVKVQKRDSSVSSNGPVFTKVEIEADYPGGQKGWYDYLVKNLKYPDAAVHNEVQGEVMVEFIVKKNGLVSDINAVSGPEPLRAESIRIIKESGKWIPAKNNGMAVDSYRRQPINYKLETNIKI